MDLLGGAYLVNPWRADQLRDPSYTMELVTKVVENLQFKLFVSTFKTKSK